MDAKVWRTNLLPGDAEISARLIAPGDVDFIAAVKMDASLWYYEPEQDIPTDPAKVRSEVTSHIGSESYLEFVIALNDGTNRPIGTCHLHWFEIDRGSWEMGYCILPEYRGQGYCTAVANRMIDIAFQDCKAHKLVAMCNEHNRASARVMEKCGMVKELVIREELPWQGSWANQLLYSLLDHEYARRKSAEGGNA